MNYLGDWGTQASLNTIPQQTPRPPTSYVRSTSGLIHGTVKDLLAQGFFEGIEQDAMVVDVHDEEPTASEVGQEHQQKKPRKPVREQMDCVHADGEW